MSMGLLLPGMIRNAGESCLARIPESASFPAIEYEISSLKFLFRRGSFCEVMLLEEHYGHGP